MNSNITRQDIVEHVASHTGIDHHIVDVALLEALNAIRSSLLNGDNVVFRNYFTFKCVRRKAKTGRNMCNGQAVHIPERLQPKAIFAKDIREEMEAWSTKAR